MLVLAGAPPSQTVYQVEFERFQAASTNRCWSGADAEPCFGCRILPSGHLQAFSYAESSSTCSLDAGWWLSRPDLADCVPDALDRPHATGDAIVMNL
jgi:hypothetical protein